MDDGVFETTITDGVLQASRPDTDWLSTGVGGGRQREIRLGYVDSELSRRYRS